MLTDRTRELLSRRIDDLEADNERLRAACRMVLDRSHPIPSLGPGDRDIGVASHLSRAEYAILVAAAGGYPDVPGERDATVRTAWGPVEVGGGGTREETG